MSDTVISIENISKTYQLGAIGTGTFYGDLQRWWARQRGLPDPFLKVGEKDHGNRDGETVWALKDINFEVKRGEAVGIIGRNGAGKSTLLKILSRVTAPTSGEIKVKGRVASLLEVGTGFHPELTGRENIFLNSAILGMNRHETGRKLDEIVDFSGVEKYIDTPVKRYSSGMYVRLAFAVAAHLDPEILVVDEVLAVGDAEFQKKCLGKMGEVTGEGRTVLFVSHNMAAVSNLCKTGVLLQNGFVHNIGSVNDVIDVYLSSGSLSGTEVRAGEFLATDRENRYQKGNLIIQKVSLMGRASDLRDTFGMGEELCVQIDLNGLSKYKDTAVGVIFKTSSDQVITSINTEMTGVFVEGTRSDLETALLQIPRLNFTPGSYSISVSITSYRERIDFAENVAKFTIVEADVYKTGYKMRAHFGVTYLDGTWKIQNKKT
jgi:lipopolysaccharide transport system ATP-binding protein